MRVSDGMQFEQVRRNVSKNRSKMLDLQNKAATQKRVTKPSDDPVAASRVLARRVDSMGADQFKKNIDYARSYLELTDQSLGELTEVHIRAKDLALNKANDASANKETRRLTSTEVSQLYDQSVNIGNRKLGDRFIFGGYSTSEKAFNTNGKYAGDSGEMLVHIDKDSFVAMNIPGSKVFLGEGLSQDGISRGTSKQADTTEELAGQMRELEQQRLQNQQKQLEGSVEVRGPASTGQALSAEQTGKNIFRVLRGLEVSLKTNDKLRLQEALDELDSTISQVVLARSQVGARVASLNSSLESLQKAKVDSQAQISNLEDADVFKVVSDINKTESALKATLETSGKLIQPSLMEFLR